MMTCKGTAHRAWILLMAVLLAVSMAAGVFALDDGDPDFEAQSDAQDGNALYSGSDTADRQSAADMFGDTQDQPDDLPTGERGKDAPPTQQTLAEDEPGSPTGSDSSTNPESAEAGGPGAEAAARGRAVSHIGAALELLTDAHNVRAGDVFAVEGTFAEQQESNALILEYSYDGELFAFESYQAATGSTELDLRDEPGRTTVVLMMEDYDVLQLGTLTLRALDQAPLRREWQKLTLRVEYAVRDEEESGKAKLVANAEVSFTTLGTGTGEPAVPGDTNDDGVVDMIDLSNIIDWFGYTSDRRDWNDWYTFFDFNNDGEIDISDIVVVARLIGSTGETDYRAKLRALIDAAQILDETDYTPESWAEFAAALDNARQAADNDAENDELIRAYTDLQTAMRSLVRKDDGGGPGPDPGPDPDPGPGNNGDGTGTVTTGRGNGGSYYGSGSSRSTGNFGTVVIRDPLVPLAGSVSEPDHWIDRAEALTLLEQAGTGPVHYRATGTVGIRQDALEVLEGRRLLVDCMDGNAVQVRTVLSDPAQFGEDLLLGGSTDGDAAAVRALFTQWFRNDGIAVVALTQDGRLDALVEVAFRFDLLNGAELDDLHFYSYRRDSNSYVALDAAGARLDANGYLHFTTRQGGVIVISRGALQRG